MKPIKTKSILLQPQNEFTAVPAKGKKKSHWDSESCEAMRKVVDFFETRGKRQLKQDDHDRVWYSDFLEFVKKEKIFSLFMTPALSGKRGARWDTARISQMSEILGFYGLNYWYTWQVSMLGLGPIWMSENQGIHKKTVQLLEDGSIFAFGLSEKEHGADLYASDMTLKAVSSGQYEASGRKYYIGNANRAGFVSTFGKMASPAHHPVGHTTDQKVNQSEFVFFVVQSQHPQYECVQNVVNSQNYVAEYALHQYPITEQEILSRGSAAWDAALNTINICKFNLGWASIGMCTHSFYEAIDHASARQLFDHKVTDFPHIRSYFVEAYSRLVAMKLFALRAADYLRSASMEDRRYLLFNPVVKMKVTTQGEEVMNLLWDVIAAKGFEKNMIFESAARDIRALPKLEGTVHVNMALIIKFMKNYFFKPGLFPEIPRRLEARDDDFLFHQGPTKGLGKIQFHDYRIAYDAASKQRNSPNLKIFQKQITALKRWLILAAPNAQQAQDFDFLLNVGELFTCVVYGQLILENAALMKIEDELVDSIFNFMIRDFSKHALKLFSHSKCSTLQRLLAKTLIQRPQGDEAQFEKIWEEHVFAQRGAYCMPE